MRHTKLKFRSFLEEPGFMRIKKSLELQGDFNTTKLKSETKTQFLVSMVGKVHVTNVLGKLVE